MTDGISTKYAFEADGNPTLVTDALGKVTISLSNSVNRLTETIDASGKRVLYG